MSKHLPVYITIAAAISLALTGCAQKTEEELAQELSSKVRTAMEAKDPDTALKALNKALKKRAFAPHAYRIHSTIMNIYLQEDRFDSYSSALAKAIKDLTGDESLKICEGSFFQTLQSRSTEEAERIVTIIQTVAANSKEIIAKTETFKLHLLAKKEMWAEVEKKFIELEPKQNDRDLETILRRLTPNLNNQTDMLEKLLEHVLNNHANRVKSIRFAANHWIKLSIEKKDLSAAQQKISALLDKKLSLDVLVRSYDEFYHKIMNSGDKAIRQGMATLGNKLLQLDSEGKYSGTLALRALESAFINEDYSTALEIIEKGIPNQDEAWIKQVTIKIKAHKAEQGKNNVEAAKYYREFMTFIKEADTDAMDPTTGITHTANMTLGLNATRIGTLLQEIDAEGSKKAYEEAASYYALALEETKNNSKSYDEVKRMITDLEKAQK